VTDVCCAAKPSGLVACPARALGQRRSSIFSLASGGHGPTLQTLHTMAHDAGMSGSAVVHVVGSQRLCNRRSCAWTAKRYTARACARYLDHKPHKLTSSSVCVSAPADMHASRPASVTCAQLLCSALLRRAVLYADEASAPHSRRAPTGSARPAGPWRRRPARPAGCSASCGAAPLPAPAPSPPASPSKAFSLHVFPGL